MKRVFLLLFLTVIFASASIACQNQNQFRNITIQYDDSLFISEDEHLEYIENKWLWSNEDTGQ